jgi:hypothetical protein
MRSVIALAAVFAVLEGGLGSSASAKTYEVHTCRLPSGIPASTEGWTLQQRRGHVITGDTCRQGGSLYTQFGPGIKYWQPRAWWVFTAPPDTSIDAYVLYRSVRVYTANSPPVWSEYWLFHNSEWVFTDDACNPDYCPRPGSLGAPLDAGNRYAASGPPGLTKLILEIQCWRSDSRGGCPYWDRTALYLFGATVRLNDALPPGVLTMSIPAGPLADAVPISVTGSDRGGGLYRTLLAVDGKVVGSTFFDRDGGRCTTPFRYPVPCKLTGQATMALNTMTLRDGFHRLRAGLQDPAGNIGWSAQRSVLVSNGAAACEFGRGAHLRAGFGRRLRTTSRIPGDHATLVRGRLRSPTRALLPGASVQLVSRDYAGGAWHQVAIRRTDRRGRFRFRVRRGPPRHLRVAYCAPGGGDRADLRLLSRAHGRLRASRRTLNNGQAVTFNGRLTTRPVPREGKLVELQAFFRGRWRTFQTLHTDSHGRFRFHYRFGGTVGTVRYRFRAAVPRETGYPYFPGATNRVGVTVRG